MSNDESRLELKVGALLAAAIAGGLALLWLMGELHFGSASTVTIDFAHTGNVVKGAPVKMGGVAVGLIEKIELLPTRRDPTNEPLPVKMTVGLTSEAAASLRTDAVVTVSTQGPLGEPYLEIWPGSQSQPLDLKAPLRGIDPPRIDLVANKLAKFLESASKTLENDPQAIGHLLTGLGNLSTTVDGVLTENRTQLHDLVSELSSAAKDLKALSSLVRTQLEPGGKGHALLDDAAATAKLARTDLPELSKKASVALGGLAAVAAPLTEEDGQRVKAMIAKANAASEKLDVIAAKAEKLMNRIDSGEGTLGALAQDKQVYDDLKSLLAELRKHPWKMLWKD